MNGDGERLLSVRDAAAGLAVLLLSQVAVLQPTQEHPDTRILLPLALVAALAVTVQGRWPLPAFCVASMAAGAALVIGAGPVFFLAAAYALYPVARRPGPVQRVPVTAVAWGCAGLALFLTTVGVQESDGGNRVAQFLCGTLVLGTTWALGTASRERQNRARDTLERASEQARQEERLRISRDLHDVLTHSVGLIAVKAGVANHVLDTRPEEARTALAVIEEVSRNALRDLRATLATLRRDLGQADPDGLQPLPGVADLPALVQRARDAGLELSLYPQGLEQVPDGIGLCAYRIVQEAVTNVVKHVGPTRCEAHLTAADESLRIVVVDDGPVNGRRPSIPAGEPAERSAGEPAGRTAGGPANRRHDMHPTGGLGLLGMRERVEAHGGSLSVGPRHSGGFEIRATIPYG